MAKRGRPVVQVTVSPNKRTTLEHEARPADAGAGAGPAGADRVTPDARLSRNNPQPPRNQAKWRSRRTSCKLLKRLVAAVGLEPTTYGL